MRAFLLRESDSPDAAEVDAASLYVAPVRREDLDALGATWDLRFPEISSSRRRAGSLVRVLRQALQKALFPTLARQSEHNATVMRVVTSLAERTLAEEAQAGAPAGNGLEFDQLGFLDAFRGSEDEIRDRQRRFVDLFHSSTGRVLDLGCGRGEFLEVLRDAGIDGFGVDASITLVAHCAAKQLDVEHAEALEFLASVADRSLGGVYSSHLVEHLPGNDIPRLLILAAAKIELGGTLLIETDNPRSLAAQLGFSVDFTHSRMFDPDALRWLFESVGFVDVSVEFLHPPDPCMPTIDTGATQLDCRGYAIRGTLASAR
jgi:SAM-dependent methyltransferase